MCEPISISILSGLAIGAAAGGGASALGAGTAAAVLGGLAVATSVAGTAMSYAGSLRAANSQNQYQADLANQRDRQMAHNNKLAEEAYIRQSNQENLRLQQEQEKASQNMTRNRILGQQAQSRVRASAGEAGVAGVSVDALLADYDRQEAYFNEATRTNLEYSQLQSRFNKESFRAEAEGRKSSLQPYLPERIEAPSFVGTALQIGTDVFGSVGKMSGKLP